MAALHRKVKLKVRARDNVLLVEVRAARHPRDRLKGRARDNVLLVEAQAARRPEAEDRAWLT